MIFERPKPGSLYVVKLETDYKSTSSHLHKETNYIGLCLEGYRFFIKNNIIHLYHEEVLGELK